MAVFKVTISKGRERRGKGKERGEKGKGGSEQGMERRGRVESGIKSKGPTITEGERRGKEIGGKKTKRKVRKGICRTNVKLLPTRLIRTAA